jgi:hypothetical protein
LRLAGGEPRELWMFGNRNLQPKQGLKIDGIDHFPQLWTFHESELRTFLMGRGPHHRNTLGHGVGAPDVGTPNHCT